MSALIGCTTAWVPLADVCETDTAFYLIIDLPGVSLDKMEVTSERNTLTVRGSRDACDAKCPGRSEFVLKERTDGRFTRSFLLPASALLDRAEAQLANGLLHVRVPKSEAVCNRRSVPITRTGAPKASSSGAALPAPELQAVAAKLISVLRRLRQLQRQGGYSLDDVTHLQDELREVEMSRHDDGTFGGRPGFEGTGSREALLARLLYRAHRIASSFVSAAEVDAAYEPVARELGEIEASLNAMVAEGGHAHDDQLRALQERLDAIDAQRKGAAFPDPTQATKEPLHGQAFLHNLLERCYELVRCVQDPLSRAGQVDPQLRGVQSLLQRKVEALESMRHRTWVSSAELRPIREALIEIERQTRVAGVFGGAPAAPVPKGQAVLSSLLHRAYRLLRVLELRSDDSQE